MKGGWVLAGPWHLQILQVLTELRKAEQAVELDDAKEAQLPVEACKVRAAVVLVAGGRDDREDQIERK